MPIPLPVKYDVASCHLQIEGMTCSSCVHMIERTLLSQVGVEKAVVALSTSRGNVEFDPTILGPRDVVQIVKVYCSETTVLFIAALNIPFVAMPLVKTYISVINFLASYNTFSHPQQDAGFDARVDNEGVTQSSLSHSRDIRKWRNTFVFSLVFAIPTLLIAFMPVQWPVIVPGLTVRDVILFTLSSTIQVNGLIYFKTMLQFQNCVLLCTGCWRVPVLCGCIQIPAPLCC